jgi:hypothetical protein
MMRFLPLGTFGLLGLRFPSVSWVMASASGLVSIASFVLAVLSFGLMRSWSSLVFGFSVSAGSWVMASIGDVGSVALSSLVAVGMSMGFSVYGVTVLTIAVSSVLALGLLLWAAFVVASVPLMVLSIYNGDTVGGFGPDFPLSLEDLRRVWTKHGRVLLAAGRDASGTVRIWVASKVVGRVKMHETVGAVSVAIVGGLHRLHLGYIFSRVGYGLGSWFAVQRPAARSLDGTVLIGIDANRELDERSLTAGGLWKGLLSPLYSEWQYTVVGSPELYVYALVFRGGNHDGTKTGSRKDVVAVCLASPRPLSSSVLSLAVDAAIGGSKPESHQARLDALREALKAV